MAGGAVGAKKEVQALEAKSQTDHRGSHAVFSSLKQQPATYPDVVGIDVVAVLLALGSAKTDATLGI